MMKPLLATLLLLSLLACQREETHSPEPKKPREAAPSQEEKPATRPKIAKKRSTTGFVHKKALPPACIATRTDQGSVQIEGKDTGLIVPQTAPGSAPKIKTWAHDKTSILVASVPEWFRSGGATPDGKLWKVSCEAPHNHEPFVELSWSDFGNGAMTHDARHLYYSGPDGIYVLNTQTRKQERIAETPSLAAWEPCKNAGDAAGNARDIVLGLTHNESRLRFHRGAPCGYEGDWIAREKVLRRPGEPESTLETPRPVRTVATSDDGAVWLGDGSRCDEPGILDPHTPGAIWVSRDKGATWSPQAIADQDKAMITAAAMIRIDPKDPNRILVQSALCKTSGKTRGGSVFLSEDRGLTWRRITLPRGWPDTPEGQKIQHLALIKGSTKHFALWSPWKKRFETTDGGQTWESTPYSEPPQAMEIRFSQWKHLFFKATEDGLWRKDRVTHQLDRVFPPPAPTPQE